MVLLLSFALKFIFCQIYQLCFFIGTVDGWNCVWLSRFLACSSLQTPLMASDELHDIFLVKHYEIGKTTTAPRLNRFYLHCLC